MKKIKTLFFLGLSMTLLAGCGETNNEQNQNGNQSENQNNNENQNGNENGSENNSNGDPTFTELTIATYPKTTFYSGEKFSNNGISLNVNFSDGTSFVTEDITTSKPSTMMIPGKQTIKAYYSNEKYDINSYVTYEIEIIDWTKEEKAFFTQTSLCSNAGVYYPKMEGMEICAEEDEEGNIDYWIELKNANSKIMSAYLDMLDEYEAKKTVNQNGESITLTFKFYEQVNVPNDFVQLYGRELSDMICFKYCASYQHVDTQYGGVYELNGSEIEDTLVIGLNKDNDLIIRYIANKLLLETMLGMEVNDRFTLDQLLNGVAYTALKQTVMGYDDEEGKHHIGYLETIAPLACEYFVMPDDNPQVTSIADYGALYPWLHGEDSMCFEVMFASSEEKHDELIAAIESKDSFVKTTRTDNYGKLDVNVNIYTIENKEYVGDLVIEVTDYIPDGLTYTIRNQTGTETVTSGYYNVYYRFQSPEVLSPTQNELYRIYDIFYGENNYNKNASSVYTKGAIDGSVKFTQFKATEEHPTKGDNEVEDKVEALEKFVSMALQDYTVKEAAKEVTMAGYEVTLATYSNDDFVVTVASYFAGAGRFVVEFTIEINAM